MAKKTQAEQRGYLLPETINPDQVSICICIPCDKNHALAFLGQINDLGYWWTWERDTEKRGKEAARVWREIYDDVNQQLNECGVFDMGCGCEDRPEPRYRYTETGELEVSYDDGETWENAESQDVRINPPVIFPPLPGADGDDKKCVAANSAVTGIKELQEQELDALQSDVNLILVLRDIIFAFVALIIGIPVLGIPAFIVVIIGLVVNFVARQLPEDFENAFDEETWQTLLCILFCEMADDASFDQAAFAAVKSRIQSEIENDVAIEFFIRHFDMIGSGGLTNLARSGYGGSRECDCNCANCSNLENWSVVFGTILEQEPGYLKIQSALVGANQAVRIATGDMDTCCYVVGSAESGGGAFTNTAYYPCGSNTAINSIPPGGSCGHDYGWTNVFGVSFVMEITFSDCP